MQRKSRAVTRALMLVVLGFLPHAVLSEASGPDYYRVVDVAYDDTLNMRIGPSANHPKIGEIAPGADGIANLGCQGGLSLDEWQNATEEERASSRSARWCLVGVDRVVGWASSRYLAEGGPPDNFRAGAPLRNMAGSEWRLTRLGETDVDGELLVRFRGDGRLEGDGGCNRFNGSFTHQPGAIEIGALASTRRLCPEPVMETETAFLSALGASERLVARHLVLVLLNSNSEILAQFARRDAD